MKRFQTYPGRKGLKITISGGNQKVFLGWKLENVLCTGAWPCPRHLQEAKPGPYKGDITEGCLGLRPRMTFKNKEDCLVVETGSSLPLESWKEYSEGIPPLQGEYQSRDWEPCGRAAKGFPCCPEDGISPLQPDVFGVSASTHLHLLSVTKLSICRHFTLTNALRLSP